MADDNSYVSPDEAANYRSEDQPPPTPEALAAAREAIARAEARGDIVFVGEIGPALSAEEWATILSELAQRPMDSNGERALGGSGYYEVIGARATENAWFIAVNNAALPDSDPRKITRNTVRQLRRAADVLEAAVFERESGEQWHDDGTSLRTTAAALESYLPPG